MAWRTAGTVIGSWTEVISDDPDRDIDQAMALDGSWIWNIATRSVLVRTDQLDQLAGGVTVVDDPPRPMPNQLEFVPLASGTPQLGEPWLKVAASLPGVDPNADQGDLVFDSGADKWNYYDHTGTWQPLGGGAVSAVSPLTLTANTAAEVPLTIKGAAGQTGDLLTFRDSTGTVLAGFGAAGRLYLGPSPSFGGGAGPMLFLGNDTSDPTTNPVGGTIVYNSAGVVSTRDPGGNITQLAPNISVMRGDTQTVQFGLYQLRLGYYSGGGYWQYIRSRHNSGTTVGNSIDFITSAGGAGNTILSGSVVGLSITGGAISVGTYSPAWGGGAGPMIFVANATTNPTSAPTGGGVLYVAVNGSLHYRGPTTDTQIAPA